MEIRVDFGQLSQAADDLGGAATKIQAELDELENMLKPLVASWEGQAQEAYRAAQDEWDKAAQNMIEIAAKMGMAVNAANDSYQAGEAKNAGRFGG
ncbi:WXG100 family type VII secretion target [Saccharopolyspora gloriosae]|uniref:ESAT-6-like protein n=1 Tax=Saccharopolyspora gloriosae TaxID=455344 RepID=A0A840NS15_9PSEU|nr:WXG100 family type VII secretion target [Saccharopolyspora gloriosae]MBB5072069.1 WXG100 family type VII secretion target [Saccharopolyspora gloriosae]